MPKATDNTSTLPTAASDQPTATLLDAHPDASLLAVCAEIVAIYADEQNPTSYEIRREILKRSVLAFEPVTLEGCRARVRAIETAWPNVHTRLHGSPMGPEDDAFWGDWKRLPLEERGSLFRARMKAEWAVKDYPPISPEEVVKRALAKAHDRACDLLDGLRIVDIAASSAADEITISSGTLEWLAKKLRGETVEIMTDLEYLKKSTDGDMFGDSNARYAGAA